jgi:hypothetical protein
MQQVFAGTMHAFYALMRRHAMPFDSLRSNRTERTFLPRRDRLVLDNAAGTVVAVDRGCLWLTLERDLRDIILAKGMRFQIDRGGRTVIAAEEDSQLRLIKPQTVTESIVARLRRAIRRHLRQWSSRVYRQSVPYY